MMEENFHRTVLRIFYSIKFWNSLWCTFINSIINFFKIIITPYFKSIIMIGYKLTQLLSASLVSPISLWCESQGITYLSCSLILVAFTAYFNDLMILSSLTVYKNNSSSRLQPFLCFQSSRKITANSSLVLQEFICSSVSRRWYLLGICLTSLLTLFNK